MTKKHEENDTPIYARASTRDEIEMLRRALQASEWQTRKMITLVQAFINHHRYPDTFNLPDLGEAERAWMTANNANLHIRNKIEALYNG